MNEPQARKKVAMDMEQLVRQSRRLRNVYLLVHSESRDLHWHMALRGPSILVGAGGVRQ